MFDQHLVALLAVYFIFFKVNRNHYVAVKLALDIVALLDDHA
jgi:hypothetical protein